MIEIQVDMSKAHKNKYCAYTNHNDGNMPIKLLIIITIKV